MSYRNILLAVDIDDDSEAIGRRAVAVADALGARTHLLHVVEYVPVDPAGEGLMPPPVELEVEIVRAADKRLEEFALRLGLDSTKRDVRVGNIKSEIVKAASDVGADLIVIGRHQYHGLALFRGGTERSLVTTAPCDVLAVRAST